MQERSEKIIPEWVEKLSGIIKEVNMKKAIKPSVKTNDKPKAD